MNSIVTRRFIECLNHLKEENKIKSFRQFALSLEYAPQSLSDILNGKRDVTIELLRKAAEKYEINTTYLFTGGGSHTQKSAIIGSPILTVVTNNELEERIAYVPVSAQAGYGDQLYDKSYMTELPSFSLPGHEFSQGTHRCFDLSGDSMEPMLSSGDKVVCKYVELNPGFDNIKSNHIYVVVTPSSVVVKRIENNIEKEKGLLLISDNDFYKPYLVPAEEIKEIWQVVLKISKFTSCPSASSISFKDDIKALKQKLNQQSTLIKNLNGSLELLMKRSRSIY